MAVVCYGVLYHVHEVDWRVSAGGKGVLRQLFGAYWRLSIGVYSVIYMRQIGGFRMG
jgi:hypothetical protein